MANTYAHNHGKEPTLVPVVTCYYSLNIPRRYVNYYFTASPRQNEWFFDGYYWISNADTGAPIGVLRLNGVAVGEPEATQIRARFTRGTVADVQPTAQSHRICETVMTEE